MSKENSFDIVSEFDHQELVNAMDQARREIGARFDLKDSGSTLELEENKKIQVTAPDEMKLRNVFDILENKIIKRGLSAHILDAQKVEEALGGKVKQTILLKQGIDKEQAKKIVGEIKKTGLKVQASVQGEQVRVTAKSRDDLQAVITAMKAFGDEQNLPLQFENYR
ncbi:MAG: YajQ family cyclic di-GMP-binding protein [Candidatus Melainabacteria bacterium]